MSNLGGFEILIIAVASILIYFIPVAALAWIIIALNRLRKGQEEIISKLESENQSKGDL